jgi:hypothetical protein
LETVMLDERRLERMERVVPLYSFDSRDLLTVLHRRQGHAGQSAAAFDVDGARAALTPIATLLRAGQHQLFTQRVKEGYARFDSQLAGTAVNGKGHLYDTVA